MKQHHRSRVPGQVDVVGKFLPSPFDTATLWMSPSDSALADGASILSMTERIASVSFTAAGSSTPVLKTGANGIGGRNIIRPDGINDSLTLPFDGTTCAGLTMMFVIRPRQNETTKGVFQWARTAGADINPWVLVQRDGSTNIKVRVSVMYQWTIAHANNATKLYAITWDGTTWRLAIDGTDQGSPLTAGGGVEQPNALMLHLGNGYNGFSNSDWGDLAIWNSGLGTTDLAAATAYLKTFYGIV